MPLNASEPEDQVRYNVLGSFMGHNARCKGPPWALLVCLLGATTGSLAHKAGTKDTKTETLGTVGPMRVDVML
eukprot:1148773-Pelagomonas_calceolata.AAC.2